MIVIRIHLDGDSGQIGVRSRTGAKGIDIKSVSGEQPADNRKHARTVLYQNGKSASDFFGILSRIHSIFTP